MSIFHLNVHIDGRSKSDSKKKSCVRKMAYNCRADFSKISDVENVNFSHKDDFFESFLMMNEQHKSAFSEYVKIAEKDIYKALRELKNEDKQQANTMLACVFAKAIDRAEKRCDAQLTREVIVSLQDELTFAENLDILRKFVKENFTDLGMIANVAIHGSIMNMQNKLHAHISLSMRDVNTIEEIKKGGLLFGKKNREWNNLENVEKWRESWSKLNNEYLEKYDFEKISHLSYQKQAQNALNEQDIVEYDRLTELAKMRLKHVKRENMKTREEKERYKALRTEQQQRKKTINDKFIEIKNNARERIRKITETLHTKSADKRRRRVRDYFANKLDAFRTNREKRDDYESVLGNVKDRQPEAIQQNNSVYVFSPR